MKKWNLKEHDKDMVVMQHLFQYKEKGKSKIHSLTSSMVVIGEDQINTAMSKTVGLPLGISTKLILNGKIDLKGVWVPTVKEIYNPVLAELENFGIKFIERYQ
jgi:saccharopine dehydrogenase (NADP+, L-glutamate forming)